MPRVFDQCNNLVKPVLLLTPDHVQAMLSMNFIASDILHFFFKHASKTEISRHLYVGRSLSLSLLRSLGWPAAAAVVVGVA